MKEKIKKILLLFIIIIQIFILIILNINLKETKSLEIVDTEEILEENGQVVINENQSISKKQVISNLEFTNAAIVYKEGVGSILEVNVTNLTDDFYVLNGFTVLVYDKDGNKIDVIFNDMYKSVAPKETLFYSLETKKNLSKDAYSLEFIVSSQL